MLNFAQICKFTEYVFSYVACQNNTDNSCPMKLLNTDFSQKGTWTALRLTLFLVSTVPMNACFCILGRFLLDPCAPPYLGSILLNCQNCGTTDRNKIQWFMWAGIIIVDTFHIITSIHNSFFYFFFALLVTIYALLQYVTAVGKR